MSRSFDAALLSLPFSLPIPSIEQSVDAYPGHGYSLQSKYVPSAAFVQSTSEDEVSRYRHIGIIGGPSSGSALGSKARNLPASKYVTSGQKDAPEVTPPPIIMGVAADSRIGLAGSETVSKGAVPVDLAQARRDMLILGQEAGWEGEVETELPGVGVCLPSDTPSARARLFTAQSPADWLSSPYTQAMRLAAKRAGTEAEAGEEGASWKAVADMLGLKMTDGDVEDERSAASNALQQALTVSGAVPPVPQAPSSTMPPVRQQSSTVTVSVKARLWVDHSTRMAAEQGVGGPRSAATAGNGGIALDLAELEAELLPPATGNATTAPVHSVDSNVTSSPASSPPLPVPQGVASSTITVGNEAIAAQIKAELEGDGSSVAGYIPLPKRDLTRRRGAQAASADTPVSQESPEGSTTNPAAPRALPAHEVEALIDAVAAAGVGDASTPATAAAAASALQLVRAKMNSASALDRKSWAVTKRMTDAELAAAEACFKPAHVWPFKLDSFQRESIAHMELEGSAAALFVAAHTSAGKTVVAEYAFAKAIATRTRAVYTSPIKALSNQKFRDLKEKFGGPDGKGVGLITGDVSVNPEAPVLIMTTEILRSMCYRGDELVRDVSWVIFDEVHYINDAERGLAYEEVLLLLPESAGLIFLSATSPNREEFAEWVGRTKRKKVYVLGTDRRPVPLMHYVFSHGTEGTPGKLKGAAAASTTSTNSPAAARTDTPVSVAASGKGVETLTSGLAPGQGPLHLIMDGAAVDVGNVKDGLKVLNYKAAEDRLKLREEKKGGAARIGPVRGVGAGRSGGGKSKMEQQTWRSVLNVLKTKELLPAIVFSFSKAKCEECALQGLGDADLNTAQERNQVFMFVDSAVKRLAAADRTLPQIQTIRGLLLRGIGVHHSGLLPIMKEVVEMLFARGLVKILFATETFAMGVNFPARTVLFNGIRKHDGTQFRDLTPGEYIQMAGRAGRRGLDVRGVVIIIAWGAALPPLNILQSMLLGTPTRLSSSFRLTYNMILNVLRTDIPVTHMMARSYAEFGSQRAMGGRDIPRLLAAGATRLAQLQRQADALPCLMAADGKVDVGVLQAAAAGLQPDMEDLASGYTKSGVVSSAANVYRNSPSIKLYFERCADVQQAHMTLLRQVIEESAGKCVPGLFSPGRLLILDALSAPCPAGSTGPSFPLSFIPALVLACGKAEAVGATDEVDVRLSVLVLCPAGYNYEKLTQDSPNAGHVPSLPVTQAPAPPLPVALPEPGLKAKKADDDDDLASMMGGGKKGKGGAKKAAAAPAVSLLPSSTASLSQAGPPDGKVAIGHFQRVVTDTGLGERTFAVVEASLRHVARITSIMASDKICSAVLAGHGSVKALTETSKALAAVVETRQVDPYAARVAVLVASGMKESQARQVAQWRVPPASDTTGSAPNAAAIIAFTRLPLALPVFNPMNDLGTSSFSVLEAYNDCVRADRRLQSTIDASSRSASASGGKVEALLGFAPEPAVKCAACPALGHSWQAHARIARLSNQLSTVRARFSVEAMALYPEMQVRFHILRLLRYTKAGADRADEEQAEPQGPAGKVGFSRGSRRRTGNAGAGSTASTVDVVALKGRVAAEVNTCDELLFTEMIFEGLTSGLTPSELAAMLSALVFQEHSGRAGEEADAAMTMIHAASDGNGRVTVQSAAVGEDAEEAAPVDATAADDDEGEDAAGMQGQGQAGIGQVVDGGAGEGEALIAPADEVGPEPYSGPLVHCIPQHLAQACLKLHQTALAVGRVQMEAGLDVVPSAYAKASLNFGLLLPTYAWACGVPFVEICKLTDVAEGSIVRCITRLDETLREVRNAARIMGDPTLFRKAETASAAISRDVIFAASLYHSS